MRFITTAAALVLSVCFFTTTQAQNHKEIGHLDFVDTVFNFGPVNESQGMLAHVFPFVNLGPEYFFVEQIDPSCNCVTPDYPTDTIHAGEKGEIVLYVDLINHPGVFRHVVTIKGNASKEPIRLYVSGYVTPSPQPLPEWDRTSSFKYGTVYIQKNYKNFGVVSTKEAVQTEIVVYNSGKQTISMALDKMKLPSYIKASLLPVKIEPKQRGVIKIMFNPKGVSELGDFAQQVELILSAGSETSTIPFVVSAFIKDDVVANPLAAPKIQLDKTYIDLGVIKTDEKTTTVDITVANIGTSELSLRSIRTSSSSIEAFADKKELKPGASTIVKIVFDTHGRLGVENKFISIFSNDPTTPIVTVKLRATVVESVPVSVPGGQ